MKAKNNYEKQDLFKTQIEELTKKLVKNIIVGL